MIFEALMTALLAWQIWMPAVDNGKYQFQIDRDGTVIRMNTQDGKMERCSAELKCEETGNIQEKQLDYKY